MPRFSAENFPKNLELVKVFEDMAAEKGCTPAQVVLAWTLSQGKDIFPIPGTKNIGYLEQNMGAYDVQISPEENKHVRELLASMGGASGDRSIAMADTFVDTPPL